MAARLTVTLKLYDAVRVMHNTSVHLGVKPISARLRTPTQYTQLQTQLNRYNKVGGVDG